MSRAFDVDDRCSPDGRPRATRGRDVALVAVFALGSVSWTLGCDESPSEASSSPEAPATTPPRTSTRKQAETPPVPAVAADKMQHFAKEAPVHTTILGTGEGPYRFTADWHLKQIPTWKTILASLKGQANLRYLEIGVYEGRSLLWMAEHVLSHPDTELVAVDIFAGDYEETFDHNVSVSPAKDRIKKYEGPSSEVLGDTSLGAFDIIYVDGSHTAADVLADAVLAWRLLKPNGLLIFDDYGWTGRKGTPLPPELLPRMAIDLFLAAYRYEIEIVHVGYQIAVRRVDNPCEPPDYCTPVGQYQYYWRDYELRRADGSIIELTDAERGVVEAIAQSRPIGSFEYRIPPRVRQSTLFESLLERLDLEL